MVITVNDIIAAIASLAVGWGAVILVVGVIVMVVVIVVDVVMGDSVQLALPVLHPLQLWNGPLSCDRRKHWWLSSRKV